MYRLLCIALYSILFLPACLRSENKDQSGISVNPDQLNKLANITTYPPDPEPRYQISFTERKKFTYPDSLFKQINFIAVDDQGRVFTGDYAEDKIHVFSPEGRYLTSMGRAGRGPGEFSETISIQPKIYSDRLFAYDHRQKRFNIFSLKTLEPVRALGINSQNWRHIEELQEGYRINPQHYFVHNDSLLIGFHAPIMKKWLQNNGRGQPYEIHTRENRYYWMTSNGQISDESVLKQTEQYIYGSLETPNSTLPFARSSLMALSEGRQIYAAWTEEFLIKIYDAYGEYQRAFYYPYKTSPLNKEEYIAGVESKPGRKKLEATEFPDSWPALYKMLTDDQGRLWIATITESHDEYLWWVLDGDGRLLARFHWPGNRRFPEERANGIKIIKNGYMYAVEQMTDTIKDKVVRYNIELKPIK